MKKVDLAVYQRLEEGRGDGNERKRSDPKSKQVKQARLVIRMMVKVKWEMMYLSGRVKRRKNDHFISSGRLLNFLVLAANTIHVPDIGTVKQQTTKITNPILRVVTLIKT